MKNTNSSKKILALACLGFVTIAVTGCADKQPSPNSPSFDDGSPKLPVTSSSDDVVSGKNGSKA